MPGERSHYTIDKQKRARTPTTRDVPLTSSQKSIGLIPALVGQLEQVAQNAAKTSQSLVTTAAELRQQVTKAGAVSGAPPPTEGMFRRALRELAHRGT